MKRPFMHTLIFSGTTLITATLGSVNSSASTLLASTQAATTEVTSKDISAIIAKVAQGGKITSEERKVLAQYNLQKNLENHPLTAGDIEDRDEYLEANDPAELKKFHEGALKNSQKVALRQAIRKYRNMLNMNAQDFEPFEPLITKIHLLKLERAKIGENLRRAPGTRARWGIGVQTTEASTSPEINRLRDIDAAIFMLTNDPSASDDIFTLLYEQYTEAEQAFDAALSTAIDELASQLTPAQQAKLLDNGLLSQVVRSYRSRKNANAI